MHTKRFPNESNDYREARDKLLEAEIELRRHVEQVAAMRRELPLGGEVLDDYVFQEFAGPADPSRPVRLSELFEPGKDTLVIYSFMYGPDVARPCSSCTSILDSLDGAAAHLAQRVNLAVVAKSPIERIREFGKERGWRRLRLLSSSANTYNRDYHAETPDGKQLPALNVFARRDRKIHHFYGTELLYAPADPGQDSRHVDSIWPLWNVLDMTPEGRAGVGSYPRLAYEVAARK